MSRAALLSLLGLSLLAVGDLRLAVGDLQFAVGDVRLAVGDLRLPPSPFDYASVPASPAEVEAHAAGSKITFAKAVEAAVADAGGVAASARIAGPKGAPFHEVLV